MDTFHYPLATPFSPTAEQRARWEQQDREDAKSWVKAWSVCYDGTGPRGQKVIGNHLTPPLATKEQAIAQLEQLREAHPSAYATYALIFFSKCNPSDAPDRAKLLVEMGLDPSSIYVDGKMQPPYVLCRPEECHVLMASNCYFAQGNDEPVEIAIRKGATDRQLEYMHERFGVPVEEMRAFRATL